MLNALETESITESTTESLTDSVPNLTVLTTEQLWKSNQTQN